MEYKDLISEFKKLPRRNNLPTFLEIGHTVGERFEEMCSQILRFFFDPNAPHGLRLLFLDSLLELMPESTDFTNNPQDIRILTEEVTDDGKRIDITIISGDYVIAIENKIGADVYNPLESYVKYIKTHYPKKKSFFVVLSAKKITRDLGKINAYGYTYLNYQTLFAEVRKNLGEYIVEANQVYLPFLFDFIRTIEKRYPNYNMESKKFFFENKEIIDRLISEYYGYKEDEKKTQSEFISPIRDRISQRTNANWWVWDGWDLGISFNDKGNRIGIESSFRSTSWDNPMGRFHIYVTVWNRKCFYPYEEVLKETFPGCFIDYNAAEGSRVYLHLPVLENPKGDEIVDALADCYNKMKEITDRIK